MLTSLSGIETALATGARELSWLITPGNWFDLSAAARLAAEQGATLHIGCRDGNGRVPLADLVLAEFQAVYETVRDWWPQLAGDGRPASLAATAHAELTEQLRGELTAHADRDLGAAAGAATPLALPPIDHALLTDPAGAARFWRAFLAGDSSPSVSAWVAAVAQRPDATMLSRTRPWLRVLQQRELMRSWHSVLQQTLADAYDVDHLDALLDEEAATFAPLGLQWLTTSLVEQLRIRQPRARRRPFTLPKPQVGTPAQRDAATVTVLIPSYRHEHYIAETIRSALAQSMPELRVLVVDDRSPDATVAAARAVSDPRLEVRVNEKNVGLGNSVLQALADITTPFVALLNSDDVFHPQRLEKCLAVLRDRPDAALVSTGMALIDRHGRRLTTANSSALFDGRNVHDWVAWYERTRPRSARKLDLFGALLERNFLATSSNLVCRADWLRGRAEVLRSLKYCLDWQLFLDAAREGVLAWLPDDLVAYRLHPTNTVWFDEQKRWAYSLEVDRVAARAIHDHVAALPADSPDRILAALRLLNDHLRHNSEVDWTGLYLNELLGGRELEDHGKASPTIAGLLAELERFARHAGDDEVAAARRRAQALAAKHTVRSDEVYSLQSRDQWQRTRIEEDATRLHTLREQLSDTGERLTRAGREIEQLQRASAEQQAGLAQLRGELEASRTTLQSAHAEGERLTTELARANEAHAATAAALATATGQVARLTAELATTTERLAASDRQLAATRTDLDASERQLAATRAALTETERHLAATNATLTDAEATRRSLQQQLAESQAQLSRRNEELAATRADARITIARRDEALRLVSEEIARLAIAADQSAANGLRWRGTRVLPGSGLGRWIRRLRKAWRKLGALLPGLPRWLQWRRAFPVVATPPAPPELLDELRSLCGEAAARLRQLAIADGNAAAPQYDGVAADARAWSFPEHGARLWRHYRRRSGEHADTLLRELVQHGGLDESATLGAIAPHLALARLAERERTVLWIAHGSLEQIAGTAIAARLLRRPWVAVVDSLDGDSPLARWARQALATADAVVARSPALRDILLLAGVDATRLTMRPTVVAAAAAPAAQEPPLRLIASGQAIADAGFEDLLLAARELLDRGVACRVHLLATAARQDQGARTCMARLTALRHALGIDAEMDFPPTMTAMTRQRLMAMRPAVFVAPSRRRHGATTVPVGVLAAMANRVPIVVTDAADVAGMVCADQDAVIVPAGDPAALATAIQALHDDGVRQDRLVQSAHTRYWTQLQPECTRAALAERFRMLLRG